MIRLLQTNRAGYPDLLLLKPSDVRFVEVKAAKGKLSEVQKYRIEELRGSPWMCPTLQFRIVLNYATDVQV